MTTKESIDAEKKNEDIDNKCIDLLESREETIVRALPLSTEEITQKEAVIELWADKVANGEIVQLPSGLTKEAIDELMRYINSKFTQDIVECDADTYEYVGHTNQRYDDVDLNTTTSTRQTYDLREIFSQMQEACINEIQQSDDTEPELTNEYDEDLIVSLGDLHFGADYEPHMELDNELPYSKKKALQAPLTLYEQMEIDEMKDTIHLVLPGDLVHARKIYPESLVADPDAADKVQEEMKKERNKIVEKQMHMLSISIFELIKKLSNHCNTVNVVLVKGEYADISVSGSGSDANLDLIVGMLIDVLQRNSDIADSVRMQSPDDTETVFEMRNELTGYVTHGKDEARHCYGTSSSTAEWNDIKEKYGFDVAVRGYYHHYRVESVQNKDPVIMTPSPAPGRLFKDNNQVATKGFDTKYKLGTVTAVTDDGFKSNTLVTTDSL